MHRIVLNYRLIVPSCGKVPVEPIRGIMRTFDGFETNQSFKDSLTDARNSIIRESLVTLHLGMVIIFTLD